MGTVIIKKRRNPDDDWGAQGSHICEDCGHDELPVLYEGSDNGWYCEECILAHLVALPIDEESGEKCYDCGDASDDRLYEGFIRKWDKDLKYYKYEPHWFCGCCVKDRVDKDEDEFESEGY